MEEANKILAKYEDDNEYHFHELDRKWIIQAMNEYAEAYHQAKVKIDALHGVSVRDFYAAEALKAEIQVWNSELSNEHRAELLQDMVDRFGNCEVQVAIAKSSFEMADTMLNER